MEGTLVFIDAGFLSKLNKHFGNGEYIKYDIFEFCKHLAKKQNLFCKHIFYYTSPPFQSTPPMGDERIRKERYDRFISKISKNKLITIREGRCQRIKNDDGEFEFGQKGVDTLMVMDLFSVPLKFDDIKRVILILCDSDFVPVLKKLKEIGIKTILYGYHEKNRKSKFSTSNELMKIVDKFIFLTKNDFLNCPLNQKRNR